MLIVQTFWSGGKSLLINNFGWLTPQHHLMSWTLSCLNLRQNYKEVILYTDSVGYKIFHEYLKLPYKKIIVLYDDLKCHHALWAYPKLLTYSIQRKPFIHIDGDVFLPNRLPQAIESGELVAQNAEIGTSYYKGMMSLIMNSPISMPDLWQEELNKESISSYNAGIIGGNDLGFIKKYCQVAFDFVKENRLNDINNKYTSVNHNILFEQISFYCLALKYKKNISTVIDHPIKDNGYTYDEFCDFSAFEKSNLMHIIGGYKRNQRICELLDKILFDKYPKYHERIMRLFSST